MSWKVHLKRKYSNLLESNPQYTINSVNFNISTNLQHGNVLIEKVKRKSLPLKTLTSDRLTQNHSPTQETRKMKGIINSDKIKKLLLEPNFDESSVQKAKKKTFYVIRRREQKSKIIKNEAKDQYEDYDLKCEDISIRSTTQPVQPITQNKQLPKVKRRAPKFGIQDMQPNISTEKNEKTVEQKKNLFTSTSYNHFFNSSFYLSSKIKESQQNYSKSKNQKESLAPTIRIIIPNRMFKNEESEFITNKRKRKQRFFGKNVDKFDLMRSKTEEFSANDVCGWAHDFTQQNQQNDQQYYNE